MTKLEHIVQKLSLGEIATARMSTSSRSTRRHAASDLVISVQFFRIPPRLGISFTSNQSQGKCSEH